MAAKSDIQKAFEALAAKQVPYSLYWRYYDGEHPLVFSTTKLREVFGKIEARFSENWCAVNWV